MKKILLSLAVAMAAVSVNAQAPVAKIQPNAYKVSKAPFVKMTDATPFALNQQAVKSNAPVASNSKPMAAPGVNSIVGSYIEASEDFWDDVTNVFQPTIEKVSDNVVRISGLLDYATIEAVYDPETGKLDATTEEGQVCFTDEEYGSMYLLSIHEGDSKNLYADITFSLDENGNYTLDQAGLYIYMADGEYAGECWTASGAVSLYIPNGKAGGYFSSNSWNDENNGPVYVENFGGLVTIYNFDTSVGHGGVLTLFVDEEEGTGECDNMQMVAAGSPDTTGKFYFHTVYVDEDGYLNEDTDESHSTPVLYDVAKDNTNYIYFGYETPEQIAAGEGRYTPVYNVVLSEKGYWWLHWYYALKYSWKGDATQDVISNVTAKATDGKIFNLAGQEVSAASKGIVIRDGKKYLNK